MSIMQSFFRHNKFAVRMKHDKVRIAARGNSALARFAAS